MNNPGMQQSILEQPSLYHCPFCGYPSSIEKPVQGHSVSHFNSSVHQCKRCMRNFSISIVPELYLHIQTKEQNNLKEINRPTGGNKIQVRSATFKCGKCEYVAEFKRDLELHEILHKEKSVLRCRLGSASVEECSHLTRHMKDHHSAPIQETRVESASRLMVRTDGIVSQQVRVEPMTTPSEEQARTEPITVPTQEVSLQEVRTDPPVPPTGNVPSQWEAQKKWRVESIKAPKSTDRSYRVLNRTMVVTPSKSARPRLAMTTFKAFRRRKQHGLVLNQVLTARKKMNKLKKKASNPLETDVALPVLAVLNPFPNIQEKEEPMAQLVDIAAPGRSVSEVEELETEADGNDEEEVEYKCTDCDFSSLCWDSMKNHSDSHIRKEPFRCPSCSFSARLQNDVVLHSNRFHCKPSAAASDLLKVKKESAAAPERSAESTRGDKKRSNTRNGRKFVFECSDCEYSTHHWSHMKRHKEQHSKSGEFKCDRCSFSARSQRNVSAHSNRYHRNPPSAVPLEVKEVKKEREFKEDPSP